MYNSPPPCIDREFSERKKLVFLRYCMAIKRHGSYAKYITKEAIYKEVADALGYRNYNSVAFIIRDMLRAGYSVNHHTVEVKVYTDTLMDLEQEMLRQHGEES